MLCCLKEQKANLSKYEKRIIFDNSKDHVLGMLGHTCYAICIHLYEIERSLMIEKLTKAKYSEWQCSLFGACFIAFGLGALLHRYFTQSILYVVILIGIIMHSWGMYSIHQRNK